MLSTQNFRNMFHRACSLVLICEIWATVTHLGIGHFYQLGKHLDVLVCSGFILEAGSCCL